MRKETKKRKQPKGPLPRRLIISLIKILALSFLGLTVFLFFFQSIYLYRPAEKMLATPASIRLDYEEVLITASDGTRLHGWFIPGDDDMPVVLFCHSNYGNISHYMETISIYNDMAFSFFIFDYRGYGRSEGSPSEEGMYDDAEAAWKYLVGQREIPPGRIVIMGRSLGGAVASHLAMGKPARALILEASFTSFPDVAAHYYPYIPVRLIARYDYSTISHLARVDIPVLVVHSRDDETVPFEHGERLFAAAPEPRRMLELSGSHNDFDFQNRGEYMTAVQNFLIQKP